jgi:conjugal transfer pilus assembly protein TraF
MTPNRSALVFAALPLGVMLALALPGQAAPLDEGYGDAFLHYKPYVVPQPPKPKASAPEPEPDARKAAAEPAKPASGAQKVDVAWLRQAYPLLEVRAIDDPSDDNVAAKMYVQRIILDKGQRYAEAQMRVVRADPLLNENNRVPTASMGARMVANADMEAQQQAVRELGAIGGLMVFVDSTCRFCAAQLPIVEMLRREFGMQALVISLDGSAPKGYTGKVLPDNGMFRRLRLQLTPSVVYVARPQAITAAKDPNRYLVVAQGFYAQSDLVKQIAYAGHDSRLLSDPVMAGLNVWDRGVADTEDLKALSLDVNDPASIKRTLQPLLVKRY